VGGVPPFSWVLRPGTMEGLPCSSSGDERTVLTEEKWPAPPFSGLSLPLHPNFQLFSTPFLYQMLPLASGLCVHLSGRDHSHSKLTLAV
jgi:hypothetical protein